jgi:hypothetical protein
MEPSGNDQWLRWPQMMRLIDTLPEIIKVHSITSSDSWLLEVLVRDVEQLHAVFVAAQGGDRPIDHGSAAHAARTRHGTAAARDGRFTPRESGIEWAAKAWVRSFVACFFLRVTVKTNYSFSIESLLKRGLVIEYAFFEK